MRPHHLARSSLLVCLALLAGCRSHTPFSVRSRGGVPYLHDAAGRVLVLRGVNVSQAHKSPPYEDFHTEADFAALRDTLGMNAVRYLVSWAAIEPEPGVYDRDYLQRTRERVAMLGRAGLYVVLDMHQDLFGEGFAPAGNGAPRWACDAQRYAAFTPTEPWLLGYLDDNVIECFHRFWTSDALQRAYAKAWRELARSIGASDHVVGFDIINEPHWGRYPPEEFEVRALAPFYLQVIDYVRDARPEWVAFVEPSLGRNVGFPTQLPALDRPLLVYAPHLYDPQAETGQGYAESSRAALLAHAAALAEEAHARGWPLWVGEYGGQPSTPGFTAYMDAVYDALAPFCAGSMYWHYGRDRAYGFFAPDGSVKPEVAAAISRPYPLAIAGVPRGVEAADGVTTIRLEPEALAEPTLIAAPRQSLQPCAGTCSQSGVWISSKAASEITVRDAAER